MITTWILYVLLVSFLIAVGGRALEEVCRVARLPIRFVWFVALLAVLGLAAVAPVRVSLTPADGGVSAVEIAPALLSAAAQPGAAAADFSLPGVIATARQALQWPLRAVTPSLDRGAAVVLGSVWLALSLSLLALWGASQLSYRTSRRNWPLREIGGTPVRLAPAAGPAVMGVLHPEIVIPTWLLDLPPEEQRLVLLHEKEHLHARDPLMLTAGCFTVALMPWNPAIWWMMRRLRLAVELDCDARVLRSGVRPHAYGTMLIDISGRSSGLSLGVPALAGSPSTLERRLLAMSTRFSRAGGVRAAAFGVLGITALLAACETKLPTAAEIEQMDVAAVEAQAKRLMMVKNPENDGVTYYLDGVEVSAEEARAVAGDRIAQVEVIRGAGPEGARIRLRSHAGADEVVAFHRGVPGSESTENNPRMATLGRPADGEGGTRLRVIRTDTPGEAPVVMGLVSDSEGLLIIDGVQRQASDLRRLRPEQIESVEVIKGPAATQVYDDPRAVHGVIRVTTKRGSESR